MTLWFKEQFVRRSLGATIWTFLLQLPIIFVLKLLLVGTRGIGNFFGMFLQFGSYVHIIFCQLAVLGLFFILCRVYIVEPKIYQTRWARFKEFFNPLFLLLVAVYSIASGIFIHSYINLAMPSAGSLKIYNHERETLEFNESLIFGIMFGCFLGLGESKALFFTDRRLLKFPQIYQYISTTLRSNAVVMARNSVVVTFKYYVIYLIYYQLFGHYVTRYIMSASKLEPQAPLNTIMSLLSVSLAYRYILAGTCCVLTIRLSHLLFQLFQIKPVSFPIYPFPDDNAPLLHEALKSDMPLLKLWACRDWSVLAEQNQESRAIIFTVSQPGNHPHNWNNIVSAILPQLTDFVAALSGKEPAKMAPKNEPALPPSPAKEMSNSPDAVTITSPTRLRSMALKSPVPRVTPVQEPTPGFPDKIRQKIQALVDSFKRRPFVQFLWGDIPDAKRRQTFAKSQPIIFLIEGLSHFVTASYTEDKFGVVQKDLTAILSILLNLQSATEVRIASSGVMQKRSETMANPPSDVVLKHNLKWTVKSAIYRIVVRFQRHIMNVPLSSEHKQMLEQYLEFRVG